MLERRFLILKYMGRTPYLATCERCNLKFFTPTELSRKPVEADQNLRNRFEIHQCRPEDVGEVATLRHAHFQVCATVKIKRNEQSGRDLRLTR
jgi:hypothetical protein